MFFEGDNLLVIGGNSGSSLSNTEVISIQKNNLICNPTDLPYAVEGHATVASDMGLITCGGDDGPNYFSKCVLQTKSGQTSSFPSMRSQRKYFGMVLVSNVLYAIGGLRSSTTMETINVLNETEWKQQALGFSVFGGCATNIGKNKIVVIGGRDVNSYVSKQIRMF